MYIFLLFTRIICIGKTKSYLKPLFGSIDVLLMEKRTHKFMAYYSCLYECKNSGIVKMESRGVGVEKPPMIVMKRVERQVACCVSQRGPYSNTESWPFLVLFMCMKKNCRALQLWTLEKHSIYFWFIINYVITHNLLRLKT